jgi:hypothetical protein
MQMRALSNHKLMLSGIVVSVTIGVLLLAAIPQGARTAPAVATRHGHQKLTRTVPRMTRGNAGST